MELDTARGFLRTHHRSVLVTARRDGRPQLSPVAHAVADDGRLPVSRREPAYKVRNVRRNPAVSLLAIHDNWYGDWVQVDGQGEIVSLPDAMEVLVDYYRRVAGEHPDWDDYRRAMVDDQRCVIRVTIERAGPDRRG
jgi:PPOX class probable F420-dependent enzyme